MTEQKQTTEQMAEQVPEQMPAQTSEQMPAPSDADRIRELVALLREAGLAYYQQSREIMSNFEYDRLYDELVELEQKTGLVLAGSPTQNVGYEVVSTLPKERHEKPMLSLNKTKSVEELKEWLGEQQGILSWKMDGLTIVLLRGGKA